MTRRAVLFAAILSFCAVAGCTYSRYGGWKWDPGEAGRIVIDSVFSSFDDRSTSEQMEDDAEEFFNRE
ncbi:MAG: hypothetical protein AB7G28_26220 [Pirellulales bacterium]